MKVRITSCQNGAYALTVPSPEGDYTIFSTVWATDYHRDPYTVLSELTESVFKTRIPPLRELNFGEDGTAEINIPLAG